ncbi:MAG: prepilin-type N-terminal cleavage/methylation domain-containing protein [Patescibacteria group bacterium]
MNKFRKGFTLVELLVVIAIIGILASVVLVSLNSARGKARDARRIADLHQVVLALENSYDASQAYPTQDTGNVIPAVLVTGGQLTVVPTDPTNSGSYIYTYNSSGCTVANQSFTLKAVLENNNTAVNSDVDGTQCTLACGTGGTAGNEKEYCIKP